MNVIITEHTERASSRGFSLLELLLALSLMAVISTVTFMTFSTVTLAWKKGMVLSDNLHHGDFVVEQIVMGLRSAYYPHTTKDDSYGLNMEDGGDGDGAGDMISWVKLGSALVGKHCDHAGSPHRVMVTLEEGDDGRQGIAVRSWRLWGWPEEEGEEEGEGEFDPEEIEPVVLSTHITGINYRFPDPESEDEDEIEWIDEWEDTNMIPAVVEITVYTMPLTEGEDAVEIRRIVEIPVAPLSWQ